MRPQSCNLLGRKLEDKVFGEPLAIALDLFVQALGAHTVQPRQVSIQHHALTLNRAEALLNSIRTPCR